MNTQHMQPSQRRVEWVDYAKGIAIFSVAALHILNGLINAGIINTATLVELGQSWEKYSFNMPVFFFLSGLFIMRSVRKPLRDFTADRMRTTVYPYFLWSIITVFVASIVGAQSDSSITFSLDTFGRMFYDPLLHYWFLYALFFIVMIVAIASKLGISRYWLFFGALVLFAWDFPHERLLAQHLVIYFAFGMVISEPLRGLIDRTKGLVLLLVALLGLSAWGVVVAQGANTVAFGPHYMIQAIGFTGVIALCAVLEKWQVAEFIRGMGRLSLEIYLAHVILGAGTRWVLLRVGVDDPLVHLLAGITAAVYGSILLAWCFRLIGFPYAYQWPKPGAQRAVQPDRPASKPSRAA
jgi:fucose 4-O-acetylase-like acetyltransferase